jgi:nardilysin
MVDGFNHKLAKLLELIVHHIVNWSVDEQTFESVKRSLARLYYNNLIDSEKMGNSLRLSLLQPVHWSSLDKRAVLMEVTPEEVGSTLKQLLSTLFMEILVQGNFTAQEAKDIADLIKTGINYKPLDRELIPKLVVNEFPSEDNVCRVASFCKDAKNSLITNYYQIGPADIRTFCRLDLLANLMFEPVFDTLRTKECLCYSVCSLNHDLFGVAGYSITVQTPADQFHCSFVDQRIEAFLQSFAAQITDLGEDKYQKLVSSRIRVKSAPDLHLREEATRNWDEIVSCHFCFDRLQREVTFLNEIELLEFKRWSLHHILDFNSRKKLSIQVVGNGKVAQSECKENGASSDVSSSETGSGPMLCSAEEERILNKIKVEDKKVATNGIGTPQKPEDMVYALKFLRPIKSEEDPKSKSKAKYMGSLGKFKQSLKTYPVTIVNK